MVRPKTLGTLAILVLAIAGASACSKKGKRTFSSTLSGNSFDPATDADGDGISDLDEQKMGLNPDAADSDSDGIPDGDEDTDGDGMSNANEAKLGFDPLATDSASTKYGSLQGNGKEDCEEDPDQDTVPLCFELDNDLPYDDPLAKDDRIADSDKDGYTNAEEYKSKDNPKIANSILKGVEATSTDDGSEVMDLYDDDLDVLGRSNATTLRATLVYCEGSEAVMLSTSSTAPSSDDVAFVECTKDDKALRLEAGALDEGSHTVYLWRRFLGEVIETPLEARFTYDVSGPSGGTLALSDRTTSSLTLDYTAPTDSDLATAQIRRFVGVSCSDSDMDEGTDVPLSGAGNQTLDQSGLTEGGAYCYRVVWTDDLGNESTEAFAFQVGYTSTTFVRIYDNDVNVLGRTNSTSVRVTLSTCQADETVKITSSNSQPATSTSFESCSTSALNYTATLASSASGTHTLYLWRKYGDDVTSTPITGTVTFDSTGPSGGTLTESASTTTTLTLAYSPPSDSDASGVSIARFQAATCASSAMASGTAITLSGTGAQTISETGLVAATQYCYKIVWTDTLANENSTTFTFQTDPLSVNTANCTLTDGYSGKTGRSVWYAGSSLSYRATCAETLTSAANGASNWPSYFSATVPSPATTYVTLSGTATTHAATSWSVLLNGDTTYGTFSTQGLATGSISFPADSASMSFASGDSSKTFDATATVSASWDGDTTDPLSGVTLKALIADANSPTTTSNGAVTTQETSIPGLVYSDTYSDCSSPSVPTICTNTVSGSSFPNFTSTTKLYWAPGRMDQGVYFVDYKKYLAIEGLANYSSEATATITVADQGSEDKPFGGAKTQLINSFQSDLDLYKPIVVPLGSNGSDPIQNVLVAYHSDTDRKRQRYGVIRVNRTTGSTGGGCSGATCTNFDVKEAADTADNEANLLFHTATSGGSVATSDAESIAAAESSTSGTWIAFGSVYTAGSGAQNVYFNRITDGSTPTHGTAINLTDFASLTSPAACDSANWTKSKITNIAVSNAFTDPVQGAQTAASRHGLAFYAKMDDDPGTAGTEKTAVYVSKINSTGTSKATLLDATAWYESYHTTSNPASCALSSVKIGNSSGTAESLDYVRIATLEEASGTFFYAGWRDTSNNIQIARVPATGTTPAQASIKYIKAGDELSSFDAKAHNADTLDLNYALAAGKDSANQNIVGMVYDMDTADVSCYFSAVYYDGSDVRRTAGVRISTDGTTVCRHPQVFYNSATQKFVAVYSELQGDTTRDVYVTTFSASLNTGANTVTLSPATPGSSKVRVTNLTGDAYYVAAGYSQTLQRLGIAAIELSGLLTLDMYKVSEK